MAGGPEFLQRFVTESFPNRSRRRDEPVAGQVHEDETDIVVVGGGGAGLAAAVSAAQHGLEVVLLEKEPTLGGTTRLSVGSLSAAGTRHQRRAGISDSAAAFEEDMILFDEHLLTGDAPHLRRLLAVEAATTLHWLEDLGVAFVGPYAEPPHRVPRMHNVVPSSRSYIARLSEAAAHLGVRIRLGVAVTGLIVDHGAVQGVRVTDAATGGGLGVTARRGVILATGDFSGNSSMRRDHLPPDAASAHPINPQAQGDGHVIGAGAGGQLLRMNVTFGPQLRFPPSPRGGLLDRLPTWRSLCRLEAGLVQRLPAAALRPFVKSLLIAHMSPTTELFGQGAILVNSEGSRFCDEVASVATLSSQPEARGFIVLDERIAEHFNHPPHSISTAPGIAFAYFDDYRRGRPDLMRGGATPRELADSLEVDADGLTAALQSSRLQSPYLAMGPVYSMLTVTEGALRVDASLRVLNDAGAPVPGLYAAGGVGQGGMMLKGHGHHIGWALTSGRVAAEAASRDAVLLR
jgi:fumarate reductase flavoprotein subunit